MKNRKIQLFDFVGLANAFDAARAAGKSFSIANNLAAYRIGGSDTSAIGGAIAYQYARTGNLGTLTYSQMQAVINDPAFGVAAQPITVSAALQPAEAMDSLSSSALTLAESTVSTEQGSPDGAFRSSDMELDQASAGEFQINEPAAPEVFSSASLQEHPDLVERVVRPPVPGVSTPSGFSLASTRSIRNPNVALRATAADHVGRATAGSGHMPSGLSASIASGLEIWNGSANAVTLADDYASPPEDPAHGDSRVERRHAGIAGDRLLRSRHKETAALSDFEDMRAGALDSTLSGDALENALAWRRVAHELSAHLEDEPESGFDISAGMTNATFAAGLLSAPASVVAMVGLRDAGAERLQALEGLKEGLSLLR